MNPLLLPACLALVLAACGRPSAPPIPAFRAVPMAWQPVDSLNERLPGLVRLYAGRSDSLPLRAWYVRVAPTVHGLPVDVVASDDTTDRRETPSSFARDLGACVAVNGGYFTMGRTPADHNGLLRQDGRLLAPATGDVTRFDTARFETARAALGFTRGRAAEITWATTRGDTLFAWSEPPANRPGQAADPLDYRAARPWAVDDALGAGPALLDDGRLRVTADEEVFFGSSIPEVHPRTAAGVTADGALILMVVDGRQDESRGVSLEELAALLHDAGAVDALNLDGGGSSALVVDGVLVNRPAGDRVEREVVSALVVFCDR